MRLNRKHRKKYLLQKKAELGKELQDVDEKLQESYQEFLKKEADFNRFWKRLGLPTKPQKWSDVLSALLLRTELRLKAKDDNIFDALIFKFKAYPSLSVKGFQNFGLAWREQGYARLVVGHKLASALMLTSVPDDMDVKAPWDHWVLEIPDGLYPFGLSPTKLKEGRKTGKGNWDIRVDSEKRVGDEIPGQFRALLCRGVDATHVLIEIEGVNSPEKLYQVVKVVEDRENFIRNYVRGVCLALHDRKHIRERSWGGKSSQRDTKEPVNPRHYTLSRPVQVDFRGEVKARLLGQKKASPTVQWLVRGHWRNQVCGAGMRDRRPTWIEPYWKGPEGTRVLLRNYQIGIELPK